MEKYGKFKEFDRGLALEALKNKLFLDSKKSGDIHLHTKDQMDSDNDANAVCKRLSELGAIGFASTQHGVVTGVEAMREAAAAYGLKYIPGVETYYGNEEDLRQNEHLILLSENFAGYRAIWKAMSDTRSQNKSGRSVMNREILNDYFADGKEGHGHVIATSACIQGVLAAKLRENDTILSEIRKIENRMDKLGFSAESQSEAANQVAELTASVSQKKDEVAELQALAKMKFSKREKFVEKLAGTPDYEAELRVLESDKAKTADAIQRLDSVKQELANLKRQQTAAVKTLKAWTEKKEKYDEYVSKISDFRAMMKSEDELYSSAKAAAMEMAEIFGEGYFFIEIQNHGIDVEAEVYPVLAQIARELHLPIVASNDVHTIDNSEEELLKRQILRSLRFQQWEPAGVGDDQLYIKTDVELAEWLLKILPPDVVEEGMMNIRNILNRCNVVFEHEKHYPVFHSASGKPSDQVLIDEILRGVKWRFPNGISSAYKKRINDEYQIIRSMGYSDYHLIVKDFLEYGRVIAPVPTDRIADAPLDIEEAKKWVKENGWSGGFTIGPGRGSAAGSLVCYCLGITSLDPIKYNLIFERYLNPERVSMPDIDSDIAKRIRPKVIDYVRAKYGEHSVCGIVTMNAVAPRGVIRDAARFYGMSINRPGAFLALSDEMAKKVPAEPGISFSSRVGAQTVYEFLQTEYTDNKHALEILRWAKIIEGYFKVYGAHAAGVVISDGKPVSEYVPLMWNDELKEMVAQVDMNHVEAKGLIKMDFLGLKTLDIITDCIRMIKDRHGVVLDPLTDIPMDDVRVFKEIFQKGRTNSVFQFESDGMKSMLRRFQPDSFEDLIILVSMFRPGPLQYLDGVIDVKNGVKPVSYLTPALEPILGKTYGAIVYQEEVMEIFQKLAGYTLGGADEVRRYMSKKKMDKLVHEREAFIHGDASRNIDGCVARGIAEDVAGELFDQMTDFAKYAFNKSHAAAYAFNSYITAWLKLHYTPEFLAAALRWADTKKVGGLIAEAKSFGIQLLPPDINLSDEDFTVVRDDAILYGLSAVKGVGANASLIIKERESGGAFTSLEDFFRRVNANKTSVENLMWAGGFDQYASSRSGMVELVQNYKDLLSKLGNAEQVIVDCEKYLPFANDVSDKEEFEKLCESLAISSSSLSSPMSAEKLDKKIKTGKATVAALKSQLADLTVTAHDSLKDRLAMEKELVGAYVSGHPLDAYDDAAEYNAISIEQAKLSRRKAGADIPVSVVAVVNAMKNGMSKKQKGYAVLDVEDRTGTVKACLFGNVWADNSKVLETGSVYRFTGKIQEDNFGDNEQSYTLIVDRVDQIALRGKTILIKQRNMQQWQENLAKVKKLYAQVNGRKAEVYLAEEDTVIPVPWRVNASILSLQGVIEQ